MPGVNSGGQDLGQDGPKVDAGQRVELLEHGLVVVQRPAVDGEHAAGLAHAHDLLAGELPVDVASQGGEEGDILHVRLLVQNGLIQVGDAPALGDVEAEEGAQLLRGLAGDGVPPGAELRELLSVPVERQIAVHHGTDAQRAHGGQLHAVFGLHIGFQRSEAGLQTPMDHVHGVGPDAVDQLVLPFKVTTGNGHVPLVDQHRLDAGGPQLDAQYAFGQIHPHYLQGFSVG